MSGERIYTPEFIGENWRWCSGCGRIWELPDDLNCPCPEEALLRFPAEVVQLVWTAYVLGGNDGVVPIERKLYRAHKRAELRKAKP